MGRPFSMWTIIGLYTEILSYSRASYICWMENNPDGHLLKVFVFLFLYLESNQVIILWKVSKRNKKDQKPNFLFSLLTLLEFYVHLQTFFVNRQFHFVGLTRPKIDLGLEIQETNVGIRISILELLCVPICSQNEQLWIFRPNFEKNGSRVGNWEN